METPKKAIIVDTEESSSSPSTVPLSPTLSPSSPTVTSPINSSPNSTSSSRRRTRKKKRSSTLEKVVLIFLVVFILNSINGQRLMKTFRTQYEQFQKDYLYSTPIVTVEEELPKVENRTEDTAIVITSSSIPSHPSTYMVDQVVKSIDRLIGLSETAPIIITIDHFRYTDFHGLPKDLEQRIVALEEYTINLFNNYMTNPRIHIIPGMKQWHIGGSVIKAMNLIEKHYPTVEYLYYLQHDFFFARDIDHTALINMFRAYPKVNWVRFPKRAPHLLHPGCGNDQQITFNRTVNIQGGVVVKEEGEDNASNNTTNPEATTGEGDNTTQTEEYGKISISPTSAYSDNNHITRFKWYKETLLSLIKINRAPENPLMVRATSGCVHGPSMGLYIYNEWNCIAHLDGRLGSVKIPVR